MHRTYVIRKLKKNGKENVRGKGERTIDISISCIGGRAILEVDGKGIEIKDYKITSSMQGGTELEVVIPLVGSITEFSMSARQESFRPPSLITKSGAP